MKRATKKVYYCDFCRKHSLTSGSMKLHEKHCTANPDRECRMCGVAHKLNYEISDTSMNPDFSNRTVYIEPDECPACVLSFLRLNKITDAWLKGNPNSGWSFDLAVKEWWERKYEIYE